MTEYLWKCYALVPVQHAAVGNALAAGIDPDTGGGETFTAQKAVKCYPTGTTFTGTGPGMQPSAQPTAYAAAPLLTSAGRASVQEFLSSGPWPGLNALGFTDAQIAAAKQVLLVELHDRHNEGRSATAFIESNGYIIP